MIEVFLANGKVMPGVVAVDLQAKVLERLQLLPDGTPALGPWREGPDGCFHRAQLLELKPLTGLWYSVNGNAQVLCSEFDHG